MLYTAGNGSHFFLANLFPKQGISSEYVTADFICIGLLGLQGAKPRITKWKILAHTGTRTHDPWFSSLVPYPWGYPVWYINGIFKNRPGCLFIRTFFTEEFL